MGQARGPTEMGVLRIEIHGSWSTTDFTGLLSRLEDSYNYAAVLEYLADQQPAEFATSLSVDDLVQTVKAFRLAGGLRLGAIRYGSWGLIEFIGALSPFKLLKDGITENREINRKRDEERRHDGREREKEANDHEEVMARIELDRTRLRLEAEALRLNQMNDLLNRLAAKQQSVAAAQILQLFLGATEQIANDSRVGGAQVLSEADCALAPKSLSQPRPGPQGREPPASQVG